MCTQSMSEVSCEGVLKVRGHGFIPISTAGLDLKQKIPPVHCGSRASTLGYFPCSTQESNCSDHICRSGRHHFVRFLLEGSLLLSIAFPDDKMPTNLSSQSVQQGSSGKGTSTVALFSIQPPAYVLRWRPRCRVAAPLNTEGQITEMRHKTVQGGDDQWGMVGIGEHAWLCTVSQATALADLVIIQRR